MSRPPSEAPRLLAVCGSLKPPPGSDQPSAVRELLHAALSVVEPVFPAIDRLDLRDARLPPFEGLPPAAHPDPAVRVCHQRIRAAAGLAVAVPAYWGGIGGAFKSFVETVSGPAYDARSDCPFTGRPTVALIVGADPASARAAAAQWPALLAALGAPAPEPPVVLEDPADLPAARQAVTAFVGQIAGLARGLLLRGPAAGTPASDAELRP